MWSLPPPLPSSSSWVLVKGKREKEPAAAVCCQWNAGWRELEKGRLPSDRQGIHCYSSEIYVALDTFSAFQTPLNWEGGHCLFLPETRTRGGSVPRRLKGTSITPEGRRSGGVNRVVDYATTCIGFKRCWTRKCVYPWLCWFVTGSNCPSLLPTTVSNIFHLLKLNESFFFSPHANRNSESLLWVEMMEV